VKPYFQDDSVTIYNADCVEVLPTLEFDVAITDPPYNLGIDYGKGTDDKQDTWAYRRWVESWFYLLRQTARLVAISPGIANVGLYYEIEPPTWVMAWNKPAAMGRCAMGFNNWEPVLLWGKMPKRPTSDAFSAPLIPEGSLAGHPCPKPLKWGMELVARLTEQTDVVCDPFMGSGTTMRAAATQNRKSIGIEVEQRFCDIAVGRLAQGALAL
jgi:DNA modification methylase